MYALEEIGDDVVIASEFVDGVTLRTMMGHTTESMRQRYAGVSAEHKLEAVGRLFARMEGEAK